MMKLFKNVFHKHSVVDVDCPYTQKTYIMCTSCNKRIGIK
jgi:hypothetical protein